jgi:hypothetical protein
VQVPRSEWVECAGIVVLPVDPVQFGQAGWWDVGD